VTRATADGDAGTVPVRGPRPVHRKATLTCQRCAHASPTDGDWIVVLDREDLASLRCPVCRAHLTTRWR
jgi:hypothetical protein